MTSPEGDLEVTTSEEGGRKRLSGAYRTSWGNRWFSSFTHNGRRIYLGTFPSEEDAHKAYLAARRGLSPPR